MPSKRPSQGRQVTAGKLAADAVETAKIKDGQVTTAKLAADAVETAKIKDAQVTAAKLAADAVETAKIKDASHDGKLAAGPSRWPDQLCRVKVLMPRAATGRCRRLVGTAVGDRLIAVFGAPRPRGHGGGHGLIRGGGHRPERDPADAGRRPVRQNVHLPADPRGRLIAGELRKV